MTDVTPPACSLDAAELTQRLATIAELGAESLIGREADGARHQLRFRSDTATRRRLEQIVAAEARCCSFLQLTLEAKGEDLILTVAAPDDAQALADGLADAFGGPCP